VFNENRTIDLVFTNERMSNVSLFEA